MHRPVSAAPHVLVFRRHSDIGDVPPEYYATPRRAPQLVAGVHWHRHRDELARMFPAEIVLSNGLRIPRTTYMRFVWIETIHSVNRGSVTSQWESEWWAEFAYHTAILANAEGFNWAAFSWSTDGPQSLRWQGSRMRRFLELAASNPDRIAIAVHDPGPADREPGRRPPTSRRTSFAPPTRFTSLTTRLRRLYETTDAYGLPRPTVLVTDFEGVVREVPSIGAARGEERLSGFDDAPWGARFCAQFPEVLRAAVWVLGPGTGAIAPDPQRTVEPVNEYVVREELVAAP
jgi:hypothetical protein